MNYLWGAMIIVSIVYSIINGTVDETVNSVFEGAESACATIFSLAGVMCFWTGIMKIAEKSGISGLVCRVISPVVKMLFPGSGEKAREYISMNMTANFLGMGNAATPMGMLAAQELDKENENPRIPSINMCMLIVLNTTSFQLIPSTIIALRSASGAEDAVSVIAPIWFASACAVIIGIVSVKLMGLITERRTA